MKCLHHQNRPASGRFRRAEYSWSCKSGEDFHGYLLQPGDSLIAATGPDVLESSRMRVIRGGVLFGNERSCDVLSPFRSCPHIDTIQSRLQSPTSMCDGAPLG